MKTPFRVSVRELVAFSFVPPDIAPAGNTDELLAGTRAHQARQRAEADAFEIEKTLRETLERSGESVTLYGRMDAYRDGETPCVEEIKLCHRRYDAPLSEHRAQARLYGAMLAAQGATQCELRVAYVSETGELVASFSETLDADALNAYLDSLLLPWLTVAVRERDRAERRDETLKALRFPFEAYRAGQRELAAQVYTAIVRKKRLLASLPTGTGKSAAVLFPALKAMGEGKTNRVLYLTARTTARQSPLNTLQRLMEQGMEARVTTLVAKEKMCPMRARCHPDDCPRAKGHFLREPDAVAELLNEPSIHTDERIAEVADRHGVCPFELALTMTELSDVVLMDVNYAFDPFAQLERIFRRGKNFTLLIDEAHHLADRVRESLSGALDSRAFRETRAMIGKATSRKTELYRAFTALLHALESIDAPQAEATLDALPDGVCDSASALCDALLRALEQPLPSAEVRAEVSRTIRVLAPFLYAAQHLDERYAVLLQARGKERALELYCLSPAETIAAVTKNLRGTVFFSATLEPLANMKRVLGADDDDACFALPSPFPSEHLAVVRRSVDTRYAAREQSADAVASCIAQAVTTHRGKSIVFFPSYAYMRLVAERLNADELPPMLVQESDMTEDARERFLSAFESDEGERLGLCVLGGAFAEGVDLPGERLTCAVIVGMGLPTPSQRLRALQDFDAQRFGDGFLYACMIPAMQKVAQAAGRVIRTENDRGLIVLIDSRYREQRYVRLLPPEWHILNEDVASASRRVRSEEA